MRRDVNDGKANRWRDGPRKEGQGNHHIRGNRTASRGHWTGREEPQDSDILLLISPCLLEAGGNKGAVGWAHTRQSPGVRKSQEIFTRGHGR